MARNAKNGSPVIAGPSGGHSLFYYLPLLAPIAAGAGVGALINKALVDPDTARRFWPGATLDPNAVASQVAINAMCVIAAVALWMALARLLKGHGSYVDALVREGLAFVPGVSILLLAALDNTNVTPALPLYGAYAVVLSAATFVGINAMLLASRRAAALAPVRQGHRALAIVLAAAAVYWATFATLGIMQYNALNVWYTDTADWEQMLWNTLHGRLLMSSAFPHMFFGEHVQFVHLVLLPFYAVAPSLKTLMVLKSLWLASGAVPVYLLATRRLGSKDVAACLALAYLLYPPMQYSDLELNYDAFRPETAAIPALLWAVYCFDAGKMWGLVVAAFFAAASKEEMVLPVAMLGLLLLVRRRWGWGSAIFLAATAWFLLSVFVVIPHYRHGQPRMVQYYMDFWNRGPNGELLDTTMRDVVVNMLRDPLRMLSVAFSPLRIDFLLSLLVPLALLPLLSPGMLFVMLPSLATTLLASREGSTQAYYQYQIALVPLMICAAVYGAARAARVVARFRTLFVNADESVRHRAALIGAAAAVLAAGAFGNVIYAKSPMSLLFYNPHMQTYWRMRYVQTPHAKMFFDEVMPLVPPDARVSATTFAAAHFARRMDDFEFPDGLDKADIVVVDTRDRFLKDALARKGSGATLESVLAAVRLPLVYDKDGFCVYGAKPAQTVAP